MKSSVETVSPLERKLNIEVPSVEVQAAFERALKGVQKSVSVKGFRKGKAPLTTIRAIYGERVRQDVIQDIVQAKYSDALKEHSLDPISYPAIEFDPMEDDKAFSFSAEFEVMRSLVNVAPGLNEIAILGKITSGVRGVGPKMDYDVIVVDGYATGHAMALLQAPQGMMEAIRFGPMGQHSREMEEVVQNPNITTYKLVTLFEELPVVETIEFNQRLKKEMNVHAELICNKVMKISVDRDELAPLITQDKETSEFALFLDSQLQRRQQFSKLLSEEFSSIKEVPLIYSNNADELVKAAADAIRDGIR